MLRYYSRQVFSNSWSFQSVIPYLHYHRDNSLKMCDVTKPPEAVRGQTVLKKETFQKEIEIPVITLSKTNMSNTLKHIKKFFFKMENLKPVQNINEDFVEVHLNPHDVKDFSSFPVEVQNVLKDEQLIEEVKMKKITICYENFSADAILRAVLPPNKEGRLFFSTSFSLDVPINKI